MEISWSKSTVRSLYLNLNQSKPFLRHMLALFCRRLGSDIYVYIYIILYTWLYISLLISPCLFILSRFIDYTSIHIILYIHNYSLLMFPICLDSIPIDTSTHLDISRHCLGCLGFLSLSPRCWVPFFEFLRSKLEKHVFFFNK